MENAILMTGERLAIAEYAPERDGRALYEAWRDPDTQTGYNFCFDKSFEEFSASPFRSRPLTVIRRADESPIGILLLYEDEEAPDLAIIIYPPWRGRGYAAEAFSLGAAWCLRVLGLNHIYAGCYEGNARSRRMLEKCGFVRHPEGDRPERHFRTGAPRMQYDYVLTGETDSACDKLL